jgi:long-chain acyl-CoA synthetase
MTFAEVSARADRLAGLLGIEPGERVALVAANVPGLVIGLFAVWLADGVAVPLSSRLRQFELERAFADCDASVVVTVGSNEAIEQAAGGAARIVVDKLGEVIDRSEPAAGRRAPAEPLASDTLAILYTSGTTGQPKGVLVPEARCQNDARELPELLGEAAAAPVVFVVPIPHAFGLACLFAAIATGALTVLVEQSTSLAPLLDALRRHRAPVLHGTPSLFARLLKASVEHPVRTGFTAGSICAPEVLEALDRRGTRILNLYGMTEIGAASACRAGDPPAVRYGTVGRALPGYGLRVVDGEVQARGPFAASYHRRAWTSDEDAGEGWFRTGDLGAIDGDGNLSILGRAKEVIHVGGFNVFPAEVEEFLLTNPAVEHAAVIGEPHRTMGEAVRAFVVPRAGAAIEPAELIRFARAGIAGYKVPYRVTVLDELPLLSSGKPDRRALAKLTQADPAAA